MHLKGLLLLGAVALGAGGANPSVAWTSLSAVLPAGAVANAARHTAHPLGGVLAADSIKSVAATPERTSDRRAARAAVRAPSPSPSPARPAGISVLAGAYCLTGHTSTGVAAGPGSIAVDPSVIPLGARLYVTGYGYGRAVDTGGALVGRQINVWETCRAARAWGMRQVVVYVLGS